MRAPEALRNGATRPSSARIASGAIARAAPAMPNASSDPARRSCSYVGTPQNRIVRRPACATVASVSLAPVKSSPYQAYFGLGSDPKPGFLVLGSDPDLAV